MLPNSFCPLPRQAPEARRVFPGHLLLSSKIASCREPLTQDPATPRRLKSNKGSKWEPEGLQVGLFSQQRAILWAILLVRLGKGLVFPFLAQPQSGGYSLAKILHRNSFSPSAPRRFPPVTSILLQVATESMHPVCSFPNFHK